MNYQTFREGIDSLPSCPVPLDSIEEISIPHSKRTLLTNSKKYKKTLYEFEENKSRIIINAFSDTSNEFPALFTVQSENNKQVNVPSHLYFHWSKDSSHLHQLSKNTPSAIRNSNKRYFTNLKNTRPIISLYHNIIKQKLAIQKSFYSTRPISPQSHSTEVSIRKRNLQKKINIDKSIKKRENKQYKNNQYQEKSNEEFAKSILIKYFEIPANQINNFDLFGTFLNELGIIDKLFNPQTGLRNDINGTVINKTKELHDMTLKEKNLIKLKKKANSQSIREISKTPIIGIDKKISISKPSQIVTNSIPSIPREIRINTDYLKEVYFK